jgi:hypothetical protein
LNKVTAEFLPQAFYLDVKMDVNDVSGVGEYVQLLQRQKDALKSAESRKGQLATDRKSRTELVDKFEFMRMQNMMRASLGTEKNEYLMHTSFVPPSYPPSIASLDSMSSVSLKDLKIATHHRGKYMIVKAITEPQVMTAIMVVVEDQNKDAIVLQLYQQPDKSIKPTTAVVSKNDVFIIKEPFLKVMADGDFGLRVDHVTDICHIFEDHILYPKKWGNSMLLMKKLPNDWKHEGNTAISKKQPWLAIEKYVRAVKFR